MFPLPQKITYWPTSGVDPNGSPIFGLPVVIDSRWVEQEGITVDDEGNNQLTAWIVYSDADIPKRSRVLLSESVDVAPPVDVRILLNQFSNPSSINLKKYLL